ncbi:MAG: hypothetical protein P1T08_00445 [Acidimicrobiia bacterium]|nr:hypothetical protein [Acidimicrobiia bacterium]
MEELLAEAQPDAGVTDMLTAMMEDGTVLFEAGIDDCGQPQGCYVFTDWFRALQLQMEKDATGNWAITGIGLGSTD